MNFTAKKQPVVAIAKKILLVDADARQRQTRCVILSTHGYQVDFAANSFEAIAQWNTSRPDLVAFALSTASRRSLHVLQELSREHSQQRITALISGSMYLCPLYYDHEMVRAGEGADDFLQRITAASS